jgi:hypothetical protein
VTEGKHFLYLHILKHQWKVRITVEGIGEVEDLGSDFADTHLSFQVHIGSTVLSTRQQGFDLQWALTDLIVPTVNIV